MRCVAPQRQSPLPLLAAVLLALLVAPAANADRLHTFTDPAIEAQHGAALKARQEQHALDAVGGGNRPLTQAEVGLWPFRIACLPKGLHADALQVIVQRTHLRFFLLDAVCSIHVCLSVRVTLLRPHAGARQRRATRTCALAGAHPNQEYKWCSSELCSNAPDACLGRLAASNCVQ